MLSVIREVVGDMGARGQHDNTDSRPYLGASFSMQFLALPCDAIRSSFDPLEIHLRQSLRLKVKFPTHFL